MSNATALRTVLTHVQQHPEQWRQDEWTNCFAGQTVRLLTGATERRNGSAGCGGRCCESVGLVTDDQVLYGHYIGTKAAQLLDLTPSQAFKLFDGDNTLEKLARLVEEFTAEEMALVA